MIYVRIIDSNGFFVEDAFVDELTEFAIETPCPDGFYLPKWDGTAWVEGKTAEEIAAIQAAVAAVQPSGSETGITERIQSLETRFDTQEGAINDLLISVIPELLGGE